MAALRRLLPLLAIAAAATYGYYSASPQGQETAAAVAAPEQSAVDAVFAAGRSDVLVAGAGRVGKLLADDREGSRHQRFILQLDSGLSLLVAHNIDLAPRIEALRPGDRVAFQGEYEWNEKGGVLHWTHHDPAGRHPGGWLRHAGRTYQ